MKPSETKFNDVDFDNGPYLTKELNRRRYLLILLNIIVFGSVIVLLFLAKNFVENSEFHDFSDVMVMTVVIIMAFRLWGLIYYHDNSTSEMTTKERKNMLGFGSTVLSALILVYFRKSFSITILSVVVFTILIDLCLHVCENKLYYKHLIEFYREIETGVQDARLNNSTLQTPNSHTP